MTIRTWALIVAVAAWAVAAAEAPGQDTSRQDLARELARLLVDDSTRRGLDEQVTIGVLKSLGVTLQGRLNRPLQETEWQMLDGIARRFVGDTLSPERTVEIAARVYARHFDEAELRELVRFQASELGRKVARLTPQIGAETLQAIDQELRASPAMPAMVAELQRVFPVLRSVESP